MMPTKYSTPLTGLDYLEYYNKHNVYHPGVDFNFGSGNQDCGQEVIAPKSGFVEYVWNSTWNSGGFGKFIILFHADGNFTRYAHLQSIDDKIRQGKEVKAGQLLGYLGNTGTTYCHLHFELLNKACAEWQRKHWRIWRAYPSGWTKDDVQKYYLNPWKWLESSTTPAWAKEAVKWAEDNEIITNILNEPVTDVRLSKILHNFYLFLTKKE